MVVADQIVFLCATCVRIGFWMQLLGQSFDGGNDAERRAIHGIADQRVVAILDGVENAPAR